MPILQPVLKMKVDELFFKWLSDPETQAQLKDYLELIKSGQPIDLGTGAAEDRKSSSSPSFNENNNVPSKKSHSEKKTSSISTSSSPPSTSALPTGSSSNPRVSGPCGRVLRRSLSTKKVNRLSTFYSNADITEKISRLFPSLPYFCQPICLSLCFTSVILKKTLIKQYNRFEQYLDVLKISFHLRVFFAK